MPSASVKSTPSNSNTTLNTHKDKEMDLKAGAGTGVNILLDPAEPFRQAVTLMEHKIRNLEKRKGKLDAYKSEQDAGKALNADQLAAVAKFGEVVQTLEFARDMVKQITQIQVDTTRLLKKLQKKDQVEKAAAELERSKLTIILVNCIQQLAIPQVREDFITGQKGAILIGVEELEAIDELRVISGLKFKQENSVEQLEKGAEHLTNLIEGKSKPVCASSGKTYKDLQQLLITVADSDYFQSSRENGAASDAHDESGPTEEVLSSGSESAQLPPEPQPTYTTYTTEQLDMQLPHMDPAVVAVSYSVPPPSVVSHAHRNVLIQTNLPPNPHRQQVVQQQQQQQQHQQQQVQRSASTDMVQNVYTPGAPDPMSMNRTQHVGIGDNNFNHMRTEPHPPHPEVEEIGEWNPNNPDEKPSESAKYRRSSGHNSDNPEDYGMGEFFAGDQGMHAARGNNNWDSNASDNRGYRGRGGGMSGDRGGRGRMNGYGTRGGGGNRGGSGNRWNGPPTERYEEHRNFSDRDYKPRSGEGPRGGGGMGNGRGGGNYFGGGSGGGGGPQGSRGGYRRPRGSYGGGHDSVNAY